MTLKGNINVLCVASSLHFGMNTTGICAKANKSNVHIAALRLKQRVPFSIIWIIATRKKHCLSATSVDNSTRWNCSRNTTWASTTISMQLKVNRSCAKYAKRDLARNPHWRVTKKYIPMQNVSPFPSSFTIFSSIFSFVGHCNLPFSPSSVLVSRMRKKIQD